jgi:hypothetical protein
MKNFTIPITTACVMALGCARSARPVPPQRAAVSEPIFDTVGEFRKGERIACAEGTDLVYVIARDGGLHSFDPSDLRFRRIGTLDCPGTSRSSPHSMAVDRSGQAWVGYDNGVLALARISDAGCTASNVDFRRARIGARFGMGFAPTPEGGIGGETLFLATEPVRLIVDGRIVRRGSLLARIDDGTNVTIAGRFPDSLRGLSGELSSRSDGKLFAFFTGEPFELAEIDPATADVRWQKPLDGMSFAEPGSGAWAFAAVGSEFFFFWANRDEPSTVTRLREDGTLEHVIRDAGIQIVGAGASTCATRTPKPSANVEPPKAEPAKSDPQKIEPVKPEPPKTDSTPFSKLPPLPPPNLKVAPPNRRPPRAR